MGKIVECAKVDPSSGCKHVVRGNTEEEVLKNAAEHAKQHGIREVTPELKAKVKAAIRDEVTIPSAHMEYTLRRISRCPVKD